MTDFKEDPKLHILRHSLGLTNGGKIYRNHFVTGEGSDNYDDCMSLVETGHMTRRSGSQITGGDDVFYVTELGKAAALRNFPFPPVSNNIVDIANSLSEEEKVVILNRGPVSDSVCDIGRLAHYGLVNDGLTVNFLTPFGEKLRCVLDT